MNIPETYLVGPYNAYANQKGARKKHWHEIIEEQALLARIIAEQQALQEASSRTLPPNTPQVSTPTVVAMATAGAGGDPFPQFFNPNMSITFTCSPSTASAPNSISFLYVGDYNLVALNAVNLSWVFGDGGTAGGANPSHTYTTTASNFTVQMTASSVFNPSNVAMYTQSVNLVPPSLTASFTSSVGITGSVGSASINSILFTNKTLTNNLANNITYLWNFMSGSNNTSSLTNPTTVFTTTGSYKVLLSATGSFGILSSYTQSILIPAPTVTASFTPLSYTGSIAGLTNTIAFTNSSTTNNSINVLTYFWTFGSGSNSTSSAASPSYTYLNTGTYNVLLQASGSYNITSSATTKVLINA